MNTKRRITGNILLYLGVVMLLGSAATKLAHVPQVVSGLAAMGFDGNRLTFIALLEVVGTLLFLIPVTRSAGLLLVSAYLGGAIATHLQHDQTLAPPSFVLLLIWLGTWLRHPGMLWSFGSVAKGAHQAANTAIRTSEI